MPTDRPTPRTAISLREPGKYSISEREHNLVVKGKKITHYLPTLTFQQLSIHHWAAQLRLPSSGQLTWHVDDWMSLDRHLGQKYGHQHLGASSSQRQVPECTAQMNRQQSHRYKRLPTSAVEKSIPLPVSMLCIRFLTCLCNLGWSSYDRCKIQHYHWISSSKE